MERKAKGIEIILISLFVCGFITWLMMSKSYIDFFNNILMNALAKTNNIEFSDKYLAIVGCSKIFIMMLSLLLYFWLVRLCGRKPKKQKRKGVFLLGLIFISIFTYVSSAGAQWFIILCFVLFLSIARIIVLKDELYLE